MVQFPANVASVDVKGAHRDSTQRQHTETETREPGGKNRSYKRVTPGNIFNEIQTTTRTETQTQNTDAEHRYRHTKTFSDICPGNFCTTT